MLKEGTLAVVANTTEVSTFSAEVSTVVHRGDGAEDMAGNEILGCNPEEKVKVTAEDSLLVAYILTIQRGVDSISATSVLNSTMADVEDTIYVIYVYEGGQNEVLAAYFDGLYVSVKDRPEEYINTSNLGVVYEVATKGVGSRS